jgi:hypothetical protein
MENQPTSAMENQPATTKKSIMLNYGLLLGVSTVIISVLNFAFGDPYEPHWSINVASAVLMIAIIAIGIKQVKEIQLGFLSLWDAIKTALGIAIIAALISMVYTFVFVKFIEPNFVENIIEVQRVQTLERAPQVTDEMLDQQATMTREYFFIFAFGMMVIFNLFIGFVTGMVSGMIMRKTEEN